MVVKDGKHKLVGFVNLGDMHEVFEKLSGKEITKPSQWYLIFPSLF